MLSSTILVHHLFLILVLYFVNQLSITQKGEEFNGGLMQAPDGMTYAIESALSREQIKAFMEDLVLVK